MTTYLLVLWHHDHDDEPVELYSEQDDDGWELRKVDVYRDGKMDYADATTEIGTTALGEVPIPPIEDIAAQSEFSPRWISREEFELRWHAAVARNSPEAPR